MNARHQSLFSLRIFETVIGTLRVYAGIEVEASSLNKQKNEWGVATSHRRQTIAHPDADQDILHDSEGALVEVEGGGGAGEREVGGGAEDPACIKHHVLLPGADRHSHWWAVRAVAGRHRGPYQHCPYRI